MRLSSLCSVFCSVALVSVVAGSALDALAAAKDTAQAEPGVKTTQEMANKKIDVSAAAQKKARTELKRRLSEIEAFSASFTQQISGKDGEVLGDGTGMLYLKKPDRFMMHTMSPDELAIYTRDDAVYYYDAAVNQVSIFALDGLKNNPVLLLANAADAAWDDYKVFRDDEFFTLVPETRQDIRNLTISFTKNKSGKPVLASLTVRMDDGNTNFYLFSKQQEKADDAVFNFDLPEDVEVDDMR